MDDQSWGTRDSVEQQATSSSDYGCTVSAEISLPEQLVPKPVTSDTQKKLSWQLAHLFSMLQFTFVDVLENRNDIRFFSVRFSLDWCVCSTNSVFIVPL